MRRLAPKGQRLTPYQKIVRAGKRGSGVRLTTVDVDRLMMDTAILWRADLDEQGRLYEDDEPKPDKRIHHMPGGIGGIG